MCSVPSLTQPLARSIARPIAARLDAHPASEGVGAWWPEGSLWSADFENGRFRDPAGALYGAEEAFNSAMGGVAKFGEARTFAPYVVGDEVLSDGGFASGVDSWDDAPTYAANGGVSQVSNALRALWTGAAAAYRFRRPVTLTVGRAYLASVTALSHVTVGSASLAAGFNTDLNSAVSAAFTLGSLPQQRSVVHGVINAQNYIGIAASGTAAGTTRIDIDEASDRECYPYEGFSPGELSAQIDFTTPAVASGNKHLGYWGDDSSSRPFRVNPLWDASGHMRLIVTRDATEQANLDMGAVDPETRHTIKFAVTGNRFSASLDGAAVVTDTAGSVPAIGRLLLGTYPAGLASGNNWDGVIHSVHVWAEALSDAALVSPFNLVTFMGDSMSTTTGASVAANAWINLLAADQAWTAVFKGVGGNSTADELARWQAETDLAHRAGLVVFTDRPNTGETSADWFANIGAMADDVEAAGGRWFVMPPLYNSASGLPDGSATAIGEIRAGLLTGRWVGHTLDASAAAALQAIVDDDATRVGTAGDYTHFNDTGHAAQFDAALAGLQAVGYAA